MQTFLPYANFHMSARCLDDKRLGKQRVECLQIMKTLDCGPTQWFDPTDEVWKSARNSRLKDIRTRKTPWYNHPAVQQWKGWECTLMTYADVICREWIRRGYADTVLNSLHALHFKDSTFHRATERQHGHNEFYTPWLGNEAYHASHRSNLLRKMPSHYKQFNWTEPDNLPYVWPSKL